MVVSNISLCWSLFGEIFQFDGHFSDGLKPPTSKSCPKNLVLTNHVPLEMGSITVRRLPTLPTLGDEAKGDWDCWILLMEEMRLTTWHVFNPVNNGRFPISTGAGFLPSTGWHEERHIEPYLFVQHFWGQTFSEDVFQHILIFYQYIKEPMFAFQVVPGASIPLTSFNCNMP